MFAYHQPFMKVKEIREGIDLDPDIEDADLFANEFVAKHSGTPSETAKPNGVAKAKVAGDNADA